MSNFRKILWSLVVLVSLVGAVSAKAEDLDASCFDYYKFQSVQVSMGPSSLEYKSGEQMEFSGTIKNENTIPVFDGKVFVRIGEKNPNYISEGQNIVDEFIAIENINLDVGQSKDFKFVWNVPAGLKAGDYRADFFFSVGGKFNLGGLPFTNEIVVGLADFKILSDNSSKVSLDKSSTKINSVKYNHIGEWPSFKSGEKVVITQDLSNSYPEKKSVKVSYDLYYWDSLNKLDLISSKTENVEIGGKQKGTLSFEIPKVNESVYYLKITTESGNDKSIVNIRFTTDLSRARINYVGLNKFPINKGDTFTLFSCYHNTSYANTNGKVISKVFDKNNNLLGEINYSGEIYSSISARKTDIIAGSNLEEIKLVSEIYNNDNKLVDKYETKYSCDTFDSTGCKKPSTLNWYLVSLISILIALALVLLIISIKSKKKDLSLLLTVSLILLSSSLIYFSMDVFVKADSESWSANGKVRSQTRSKTFDIGFFDRVIAVGDVSYTHTVTMTGRYNSVVGNQVSFSYAPTCTYNRNGGSWDTPYCSEVLGFAEQNGGGRAGKMKFDTSVTNITSVISSNPAVMTCSGLVCTAVAPGTTSLRVRAGQPTLTPKACVRSFSVNGQINCRDSDPCQVCTESNQSDVSVGGRLATNHIHFISSPSNYNPNIPSTTLGGFESAWDINVTAPPVVYGVCGSAAGSCSLGTASAASTTADGTNRWFWSCTPTGGGVTWCFAPKDAVCGSIHNVCTVGTSLDVTDTSTQYLWKCVSSNGGATSSCSENIIHGSGCSGSGNCNPSDCIGVEDANYTDPQHELIFNQLACPGTQGLSTKEWTATTTCPAETDTSNVCLYRVVPGVTKEPRNLSATPTSCGSVSLSWQAPSDTTDVRGYYIFSGTGNIGYTEGLSATSYNDTNLSGGTTYNYTVSSYYLGSDNLIHRSSKINPTISTTTPACPSFGCDIKIEQNGTSVGPVYLNRLTTISSQNDAPSGYSYVWTIDGQPAGSGSPITKIFNTVGSKTISLSLNPVIIGQTCSTSTTVIQGPGSIEEQ